MSEKQGMKERKKVTIWEKILTREVSIEYKACLYFFCYLFYYCVYRVAMGQAQASILHMGEMILVTYAMCYVQSYLLGNFDEGDLTPGAAAIRILLCTALYTGVAFAGKWFDGKWMVIAGFAVYVLISYLCAIWVFRRKRDIDDRILNEELLAFKREEEEWEKM